MSSDGGADYLGAEWGPPQSGHGPDKPPNLWDRVKQAFAPVVAFLAVVIKLKSVLFLGSMAVSIAAYAQLWGWKYATGVVLLLLVHELGHVVALRLRGIRANGVVFIPFIAALTTWRPLERRPYQEAETALAGPVAGALAAFGALWVGHATGSDLWRALAFSGLLLNLFNLAPVPFLDGGRVGDLVYPWVWAVIGIGLVGYIAVRPQPLAVIVLLFVGYMFYTQVRHPAGGDRATVEPRQRQLLSWSYVALVVVIVIGMHATYVARTFS